MIKKRISMLALTSVLFGSLVPGAVFAEGSSMDGTASPKTSKAGTTVEWIAGEMAGKKASDFDPAAIPQLTDAQISAMTWDQLPFEDARKIYRLYDRKTLQIAAYFYSNLERFLSYEEQRKTYDYNDADILKMIGELPKEQADWLFTYTPAIQAIVEQAKEGQATKGLKEAAALAAPLPVDVKYTEQDQKWNYAKRNTDNPVDDLYRTANVVENDLVLEGKHGMDLVLQRSYNSLGSKVLFPGYGDDGNVVYSQAVPNDTVPFAAGWDFNIPSFTFSEHEMTTKLDDSTTSESYSEKDESPGTYKWFAKLDDGSSYERGTSDSWRYYPYQGVTFRASGDGYSAKLTKNGITYEYTNNIDEGQGITITKKNPQGDRIKYFLPNSYKADIEITDTVGRLILLKKNGPYNSISDMEVYADSTKQQLLKRIHYTTTAKRGSNGKNFDYVELDNVTEISPTNESKEVANYQYHDPSVTGRAEFNFERKYELPKTNGAVDINGPDSQTYITKDNATRKELSYLLLKEAAYPVQGLKLNYKYGTYNKDASMLNRGVVRQYQDDYAITYVSYHPVTSVTYSYMPMSPNPVDGTASEKSFTLQYEMLSPEIWKTMKANIPRLTNVATRSGDKIVSKEQPTGQIGYTIEKTYRLNRQGNHVLSLVKQTAEETPSVIYDGGKQYKYVPVTYTSYKYEGNRIKPVYEYSFVDPQGTSVNQSVYDYLLHNTEQRPSESEMAKYANQTYREYNAYGDVTLEKDALGNVSTWEYYVYNNTTAPELRLLTSMKTQAYNNAAHKRSETLTYNADYLVETDTVEDSYPGSAYTDKQIRTYTYQNKLLSTVVEQDFGAEPKTITQTVSAYDQYGVHPATVSVKAALAKGQAETPLTMTYQYDNLGQLIRQGYPDNSKVGYSYDMLGRLKESGFIASSGEFRYTTYDYDDAQRKVTKNLPDSTKVVTRYTPFGDVEYQAQIGTNGQERPLVFNKYMIDGRHLAEAYPYALKERKTSYTYNTDGTVYSKTDPIGTTLYGRTNVAVDAASYVPTSGSVEKQPNGLEQVNLSDRYGNQVKTIAKTGDGLQEISSAFSYDAFGHPVEKVEKSQAGDSRTWKYMYDLRNQPIYILDPEANVYRYGYDSLGNLVTVDENNTLTTRYNYNSLSWKLREEYVPAQKEETYTFDVNGNLKQVVDKAGNRHDYTYTPFYDVATISTKNPSGSETNKETREYKPNTSLVSKWTNSNGAGTSNNRDVVYTYDPFQRMDSETAFGRTYTIGYTDNDELMDKLTYPDSTAITYSYDAAGRLRQVSGTLTGTITYGYSMTGTGETITTTYPNGVSTERKHNSFGQAESLEHKKNGSSAWTETNRYQMGNVISITRDGKRFTYEYDKIDRLKTETTPAGTNSYTYDGRGNRQTLNGLLPEDSNKNTTYTFDAINRLRSFTNAATSDNLSFTYYGDGLRATKVENGAETRYVYLNGKVIEELDATGKVKAQNVWGNELLMRKDAATGKKGYYGYNGHGDVVSITDETGNTINRYEYDSWGNVTAQSEGMVNPFKYSGEMYDEKTGLLYLRARYYDPKVGRFISEDTYKGQVDNPLSLNRYTYTHNSPLRFVDSSGNAPTEVLGGGGGIPAAAPVLTSWGQVVFVLSAGTIALAEINEEGVKVPTEEELNDKQKTALKNIDTALEEVDERHLEAYELELSGEVLRNPDGTVKLNPKNNKPWDHVTEVKNYERSIRNGIESLNKALNSPNFKERATQKTIDTIKDSIKRGQEMLDKLKGIRERVFNKKRNE